MHRRLAGVTQGDRYLATTRGQRYGRVVWTTAIWIAEEKRLYRRVSGQVRFVLFEEREAVCAMNRE